MTFAKLSFTIDRLNELEFTLQPRVRGVNNKVLLLDLVSIGPRINARQPIRSALRQHSKMWLS